MDTRPPRQSGPRRFRWLPNKYQWLFLALVTTAIFAAWCFQPAESTVLEYGELKQLLRDPTVRFEEVEITRTLIRGKMSSTDQLADGKTVRDAGPAKTFRTDRGGLENDQEIFRLLDARGIAYQGQGDGEFRLLSYTLVPPLIIGAIAIGVIFLIRWLGGGSAFSFGRSKPRMHVERGLTISFQDVAGIDEAVDELREVVDFLKTPGKYQALGGRIPKGVLLVGPPGTGKTLLAKAVAGEAHVPFFNMSGSEFVEMFVGVGAARVRDLFSQAMNKAPCIIFIDELDALGKARHGGPGSHDEREQTLNQLLVEMDGFNTDRGVIIMAATNRPETLDNALLRPGRFDRQVVVDRPDINGRDAILKVHARHVKLAAEVDLRQIAALTPGFVGADLANCINEAALMAARKGRPEVLLSDLEEAIERGVAGLEKKKRAMHPVEKERVAYHESGHALVACLLPNTDPVHKVSIIPRGIAALGYTMQRPEDDRYLITKSELLSRIKVLLGGISAEELIYAETSSGAQNDLERASQIARRMVTQFGMSRLGRVCYQDQNTSAFLSSQPGAPVDRHFSEQTAREIDLEVRTLIAEAAAEVGEILSTRRGLLEAVTARLIEKESIDGAELREIIQQHFPGPHVVPGTVPVEAKEMPKRVEVPVRPIERLAGEA